MVEAIIWPLFYVLNMFKNSIINPKDITWQHSYSAKANKYRRYCVVLYFFKNDISLNFILREVINGAKMVIMMIMMMMSRQHTLSRGKLFLFYGLWANMNVCFQNNLQNRPFSRMCTHCTILAKKDASTITTNAHKKWFAHQIRRNIHGIWL